MRCLEKPSSPARSRSSSRRSPPRARSSKAAWNRPAKRVSHTHTPSMTSAGRCDSTASRAPPSRSSNVACRSTTSARPCRASSTSHAEKPAVRRRRPRAPPESSLPAAHSESSSRAVLRGRYDGAPGAIAQLGERRHGMAEVVGSIPTSSTEAPMRSQLPPGPHAPALLQTIGWWSRPTAYLERCRARYGSRFTVRLIGQSPFLVLSDPDELKQLFQAPPEVLHPGEGARILEPVVGANSVILLDEAPHLRQRKLLLPAFHGESMQRLASLMVELAEDEVAGWPRGEAFPSHPRLQRLTLEIILRTVFGLERGAQLESLRELLREILDFGDSPLSLLPFAPQLLAGRRPMVPFEAARARADELIFALIEERRGEGSHGEDVLSLLLAARHEDGSEMSPAELRDELMTALVAGHETTASQLAWA